MAKVLLAKARFTTYHYAGMVPPLGLMYIAAALRQRGHLVRIYESGQTWADTSRFVQAATTFRPDVVGLSATSFEASSMESMAAAARTALPGVPIVVGGPHATAYPERCLRNPAIDFVVRGEGEQTVPELVDVLRGGGQPASVAGVVSRSPAGDPLFGPTRELLPDLDSLPFPAWDLIDVDFYAKHTSMATIGRRRYMTLVTSRGCPYHCIYCHEVHGKRFRARSPANVLAEMEDLHRRLGINDFEVVDDIFNLDRDRMHEILGGVAASGHRFTLHFPNALRADLLDEPQLQWLRKAGTLYLCLAVETAVPRLQRLIRKNLRLDVTQENIAIAVRQGMYVNGFFMLGFPTETAEEARATVDYAVRSPLHQALFFIVTPFEGTELHELSKDILRQRGVPDRLEDLHYFRGTTNVSAMADHELFSIQRQAYARFYGSPRRVGRILWKHPRRRDLVGLGLLTLAKMVPRTFCTGPT
jgi:radical SAM superfamily enzyme YgiQ (UPF0313 family)